MLSKGIPGRATTSHKVRKPRLAACASAPRAGAPPRESYKRRPRGEELQSPAFISRTTRAAQWTQKRTPITSPCHVVPPPCLPTVQTRQKSRARRRIAQTGVPDLKPTDDEPENYTRGSVDFSPDATHTPDGGPCLTRSSKN